MRKFLVIGGNGLIGHFLTRLLIASGHRPVVMSPTGSMLFLSGVGDKCDVVKGSVAEPATLERLFCDYHITHVAHLGALPPAAMETDPALAVRVGVEGLANLLEVAKRHGAKRVVYASSKAIYGIVSGEFAHPTYKPLREDDHIKPVTVYGITNLAAEALGSWYRDAHNMEFIALRFGSTLGPGKTLRPIGSLGRYSAIIESAMAGRPIEIPSGADGVTDTIFNDDVARAFIRALDAAYPQHAVFNIGTGKGLVLRDFAAAVRRRFPAAQIALGPGHEYLPPHYAGHCVLDVTRAREELGFTADPDVDRMVAAYVDGMGQLGLQPAAAQS